MRFRESRKVYMREMFWGQARLVLPSESLDPYTAVTRVTDKSRQALYFLSVL